MATFAPGRGLQRIIRRNVGIAAKAMPSVGRGEHYSLFHRYVRSRHGDGGMAGMSFDDYLAMVQDTPVPSELIEFRTPDDQLYGVCLTDPLDDGLSRVLDREMRQDGLQGALSPPGSARPEWLGNTGKLVPGPARSCQATKNHGREPPP